MSELFSAFNLLVRTGVSFHFFALPLRNGDDWHYADVGAPGDWESGWWLCVGRKEGRTFFGPVPGDSSEPFQELISAALPVIRQYGAEAFCPLSSEEAQVILVRFQVPERELPKQSPVPVRIPARQWKSIL